MGTKLNRQAYQRLIDENLKWLDQQPSTLEREHIKDIVRLSPVREYYIHDLLMEMQRCENNMCSHCVDLLCKAEEAFQPANPIDWPTAIPRDMPLADALKDRYRMIGTVVENVSRLVDNAILLRGHAPKLATEKLVFSLVFCALLETNGVSATAIIADADELEKALNRLAGELGFAMDSFKLNLKTPLASSKPQ